MADEKPAVDISAPFRAYAGHSTIGFLDVSRAQPLSTGSGTLIGFHGIQGVLTCAHVLERNLRNPEAGLLLFPAGADALQMLRLQRRDMEDYVHFRGEGWPQTGPDLAFIRLPPPMIDALTAKATFINGDLQRERYTAGEPGPVAGTIIFGVLAEATREKAVKGKLSNTAFRAPLVFGDVVEVREANQLDLFLFRPHPEKNDAAPASYGGMSGGGLWRIYLNDDGSPEFRFTGVAFHEAEVKEQLHLVGHGPRSIYGALHRAILTKWG